MSTLKNKNSFHLLLDLACGSCGKGAISPRLAEIHGFHNISCHNLPNAGHTVRMEGRKFVSKAIPTPCFLQAFGTSMVGFVSPGCGFAPQQIVKEWVECGKPDLIIHDRAVLVLPRHAAMEREGKFSTKHLASTMQGSAAASMEKMMRLPQASLARDLPEELERLIGEKLVDEKEAHDFLDKVTIADGSFFREMVFTALDEGGILHEGSQGFALSLNHGLDYPYTTSRDCDTGQALSYMGVPPQRVGEVWGVIRAGHMIRVGNVVEDGVQKGYSGDGYYDQKELTWKELGTRAGMDDEQAEGLLKTELTTVTGRLRRVFTESFHGTQQAIRTCGVTQLVVNFIDYINVEDYGKTKVEDLTRKSRAYLDQVQEQYGLPVTMVGTGPEHHQYILTPE